MAATRPAAQPSYILRGHAAQIHTVRFARHNTRLLTGDAEGWIVYWKVETKRALAVWKAHEGPILDTSEWACDKIITHGRDHHLRIWQIRPADETRLATTLPVEQPSADQQKPWLLYALPVNTLNFCAFSICPVFTPQKTPFELESSQTDQPTGPSNTTGSILIAVPARDDKKVEVYQFPEQRLRFLVPNTQSTDTGMVMAVKLVHQTDPDRSLVLVGYEGGLTAAFELPHINMSKLQVAQLVYLSQPHTQPILSLDASPDGKTYFTSSADAIIAAHRIPELPLDIQSTQATLESDNPAAATPPPNDSTHTPTPIVSTTQQPPLAPHPEPLSFPKTLPSTSSPPSQAGLSALLASAPPVPRHKPPPTTAPLPSPQPPYKTTNTKHSGQQSLCVRSDGRLLATGGWDTRIRIYSATSLREVAVLKWHKQGVYAVAFSELLDANHTTQSEPRWTRRKSSEAESQVARVVDTGLAKLQRQREEAMQRKHWVAAGAKDGRVSLWEVF